MPDVAVTMTHAPASTFNSSPVPVLLIEFHSESGASKSSPAQSCESSTSIVMVPLVRSTGARLLASRIWMRHLRVLPTDVMIGSKCCKRAIVVAPYELLCGCQVVVIQRIVVRERVQVVRQATLQPITSTALITHMPHALLPLHPW